MNKTIEHKVEEFNLPDSTPLEEQIISEIVLNPEMLPTAREYLKADYFSDAELRKVWQIVNDKAERGESYDFAEICIHLNNRQTTAITNPHGGTAGGIGERGIRGHAIQLQGFALRRKAYAAAVEILHLASNPTTDAEELIAYPDKMSKNLELVADGNEAGRTLQDALNDFAEEMQQGDEMKIPTGIEVLDRATMGGFGEGNLVVLAARPSVGKTALMLQFADIAGRNGKKVLIFSIEMTNKELTRRLLYRSECVKPSQVVSRNLDWNKFEEAVAMYSSHNLRLYDKANTTDSIVNTICRECARNRCDIAFIDYLGLIRTPSSQVGIRKDLQIQEITARLKQVAKERNIVIVLLCQLNRNCVNENRSPELRDLRDSGSIEQDADIVLMAEHPQGGNPEEDEKRVDLWIRKNRAGRRDINIPLEANKTYTEFHLRE